MDYLKNVVIKAIVLIHKSIGPWGDCNFQILVKYLTVENRLLKQRKPIVRHSSSQGVSRDENMMKEFYDS
jgi:hypothetical protein